CHHRHAAAARRPILRCRTYVARRKEPHFGRRRQRRARDWVKITGRGRARCVHASINVAMYRVGAWIGVAMVGWLTAGCAERQARAAFASDFDCPQAQVEATNTEAHFRVHGCGQTATYVCQRFCALETVGSDGTTEPWSGS